MFKLIYAYLIFFIEQQLKINKTKHEHHFFFGFNLEKLFKNSGKKDNLLL